MSSEMKTINDKQQQSSLEFILKSINLGKYLSQCQQAGLDEILGNINIIENNEISQALIEQGIPRLVANAIANKIKPPPEQEPVNKNVNSPRPVISNELLKLAEHRVALVTNEFYTTTFYGKIDTQLYSANAVSLGVVKLENVKYKMNGLYLILISNVHIFAPLSKTKNFRVLHSSTFTVGDVNLTVEWKIPLNDGIVPPSMIFISKDVNTDICLILISKNDVLESVWTEWIAATSLSQFTSMKDLYNNQIIPDDDDNKVENSNLKIQKNLHVIVAGAKLFGNWTQDIVSGIGEIVHTSSEYECIINLPGRPGLSSGGIFGFNQDQNKIYLLAIVQGGTTPKIIRACNIAILRDFLLVP